jgi:hypothetical protein
VAQRLTKGGEDGPGSYLTVGVIFPPEPQLWMADTMIKQIDKLKGLL